MTETLAEGYRNLGTVVSEIWMVDRSGRPYKAKVAYGPAGDRPLIEKLFLDRFVAQSDYPTLLTKGIEAMSALLENPI